MKILVNEKISQHKYKTPEGYLICVDSVLARTGNQTYRKNELFADSEDDSEIEVGRSPEEVFSAETLASFENKPITIEHPDEDVNVENYKDYSVGFVRDVKQGKFDGQDVILGTLVITDKDAIEGIENGEHVELSCGYDCDIEDGADGYQQKHIRGNHVALCEAGRAGIAKIIDSVDVTDERTSMTKEITKAISGLKSTLFKTDFVFESDAHGMTLTATDSYGIDPNEKSQAMRFVEMDVKAIESRLSKITGYTVTIAKYSLYKERYSDPNAGLNCERIWLYGKKIRDSVKDAKKYAVEFTYDGDSVSNYLGQVWVYANSEKEALKKAEQWTKNKYDDAWNFKIVPKAYSNSEVIDSVEETDEPRLDRAQRRMLQNYLSMISTFTSRDTDIKDVLRPLAGKGFKYTIDKIEGWIWKKDEMAYKNYYISLDGYRDTFKVTLYADPDKDWKVTEVNAYFTDSVKDETPDEEQTTMLEKDFKHFEDAKEVRYQGYVIQEYHPLHDDPEGDGYVISKNGIIIGGADSIDEAIRKINRKELKRDAVEDADVNDTVLNWKNTYLGEETDEIRLPQGNGSIIASYDDIRNKTRIRFLGGSRGSSRDDVIVKGKPKTLEQLLKYIKDSVNTKDSFVKMKNTFSAKTAYAVAKKYNLNVTHKAPIGLTIFTGDRKNIEKMLQDLDWVDKRYLREIYDSVDTNESINDVDPRSGESKDDFIARFMKETKNEYPDEKQRLAVAYSYWEKKGRDLMVKDADWTITIDFPKDTIVNMSFMARGENDESNKIIPWVNTFATIKDHSATMTMKPKKTIYISDLAYKLGAKLAKDFVRDIESQVKNGKIKDDDGFTIEDASNFKYHSVYPFTKGLRFFVNGQQIKSVGQYTIDGIDCYIGNKAFNIPLIDTQTKDAKKVYEIRWIDQYQKSKGYDKTFWLNVDTIKADTATEALEKLKNIAVMRGTGTRYVTVVNVKEGNNNYQLSGNVDEVIRRLGDSKPKDSIYSLTIQGQKSKKLVRAKDAREAIDKYTKMFPKDKVKSVKKTDKFNNIIEIIKR